MTFEIRNGAFCLDSQRIFLISGEIHYFRIRRELWDKHLSAAREAGLRAVSSYVPWAWHEPEEQVFDFDGSTCPERDLTGWINRCKAHGLHCILKPGPFILAEFRGAGLPDWFLDRYGDEIRMHNSRGDKVMSDGVSLFHPAYLDKVRLWYDRVMPLISQHEIGKGGPVIMMQVCNEIGVFSWLAHQADYCEEVRTRFMAYLSRKFSSIDTLNQLWGTAFKDFQEIQLPPDGTAPYSSKGDRGRDYEWHCFWRSYYGDYLRMLSQMARDRGVTVPLYHNLPGWIYGHGYEFPVNITMYDDLFGEKSEIIFGADHIPEFVSHRNLHDDRIINDIIASMQGNKPLFAAEFQSGSREYHVVTNPREMELFYKAGVANGLTGWNYYMFSQGKNPPRKGFSGETFYWFTPLSTEGERSSAFPLVSRMNKILKTSEEIIVNASRKADIGVLFYPPYYATELERPETGASGLLFNPSSIRRPAYFDGLLKALQVLNIDYDMADLTRFSAEEMNRFKQIWAFCTDEMNADDQQKLVDYCAAGGDCVIFPCLPDREMSQQPCTIIRDALAIRPAGTEITDSPLIDLFDLKDIKCANPQVVYDAAQLNGAEIIARTLSGKVCGFVKGLGKGRVSHLGTWIGFDTEGHKPAYQTFLERTGAKLRQAGSENEFISVRERFTEDRTALLFIGNYYNEDQVGGVSYSHPATGEQIRIPFTGGTITWPPLYAVLTPVCLQIAEGIRILHTTSDILGIKAIDDKFEISLTGDRDLPGEIVFEGVNIKRITSAQINGTTLKPDFKNGLIIFTYNHLHNREMIFCIILD